MTDVILKKKIHSLQIELCTTELFDFPQFKIELRTTELFDFLQSIGYGSISVPPPMQNCTNYIFGEIEFLTFLLLDVIF